MNSNRPTPGWTTWTFCATLDRLITEVDISARAGHKSKIELVRGGTGWDIYTYEEEEPDNGS
jgi:hypothetical protein